MVTLTEKQEAQIVSHKEATTTSVWLFLCPKYNIIITAIQNLIDNDNNMLTDTMCLNRIISVNDVHFI